MRIDHVRLGVPDPAAAAAFHRDVLGLPVELSGAGAVVRIGWTTLELAPDAAAAPSRQHLAVTVPPDAGRRAHDWLADRCELLAADGRTLLDTAPSWDAESVYFRAPDGMVLELIARRRFGAPLGAAAFGPDALLGISEVGVPVADVPGTAARLRRELGVEAFGGMPSATFGAVGDDEGLLILVAAGRTWFPTSDAVAAPAPWAVRVSGTVRPGVLELNREATLTACG